MFILTGMPCRLTIAPVDIEDITRLKALYHGALHGKRALEREARNAALDRAIAAAETAGLPLKPYGLEKIGKPPFRAFVNACLEAEGQEPILPEALARYLRNRKNPSP